MRKLYIMQLLSCNNRHITSYLHWIKFFFRTHHFHIHYKENLTLFHPTACHRVWQKLAKCPYLGQDESTREAVSFGNFVRPFSSKTNSSRNFMVTPCINNIQHFNFQMMHTTLKNVKLLKHFKISKTAPTCFGLQGNHHQGATVST